MAKRQLKTYVTDKTKSVKLMDRFEGREDGLKYDQMLIENRRYGRDTDGKRFTYRFVVERCKYGTETEGDITFTDFKKGNTYELSEFVKSQITPEVIKAFSRKDQIYYFKKPYLLRAQNSSNRCGYGWEWDWSGGIGSYTEGTYYGETTDYAFAGIYIA